MLKYYELRCLRKKKVNKSSFSVNFRSFFFSLDNENKMSAFQMLAISLSGSFCQEIANSLHCKPDRRSLQCDSYCGSSWHSSHAPPSSLPHPAQRNAHAKSPPNYTALPAVLTPRNLLVLSDLWGEDRPLPLTPETHLQGQGS